MYWQEGKTERQRDREIEKSAYFEAGSLYE